MARHPRWVRRFIEGDDLDAIARAVAEAERVTSAEIRVHLDHRCAGDAMARAIELFGRFGMHHTALRNGVLIYIAVQDRKLAVIGDTGIHERVGAAYWQGIVDLMITHLRAERPRDGLLAAVREVGEALRRHFPRASDDRNELSDEVSFSDPDR
jgi:uncharacterized membrane protein